MGLRGFFKAGDLLFSSGKYEEGWFFGWTSVEIRGAEVVFQVHALDPATLPAIAPQIRGIFASGAMATAKAGQMAPR